VVNWFNLGILHGVKGFELGILEFFTGKMV
jgi:hypothetical protein